MWERGYNGPPEVKNLCKSFSLFIILLPKRPFTLMWWRDKKKGKWVCKKVDYSIYKIHTLSNWQLVAESARGESQLPVLALRPVNLEE